MNLDSDLVIWLKSWPGLQNAGVVNIDPIQLPEFTDPKKEGLSKKKGSPFTF